MGRLRMHFLCLILIVMFMVTESHQLNEHEHCAIFSLRVFLVGFLPGLSDFGHPFAPCSHSDPNSNFKPTLNPSHIGERSQDQSGICVLFLHFVVIEVHEQWKTLAFFYSCYICFCLKICFSNGKQRGGLRKANKTNLKWTKYKWLNHR